MVPNGLLTFLFHSGCISDKESGIFSKCSFKDGQKCENPAQTTVIGLSGNNLLSKTSQKQN